MKIRAKIILNSVTYFQGGAEQLKFSAVGKSDGYPADGSDEDNTFANWTPSASLELTITNPKLYGLFKPGQKFYVDFNEIN